MGGALNIIGHKFLGDCMMGKLISCSTVLLSYQLRAEGNGREGMGVQWERGTAIGEGL